MALTVTIPTNTKLRFIPSVINSPNLRNRIRGAIILTADAILLDNTSSSQLIKLAAKVANDESAIDLLVTQVIKHAISVGNIIVNETNLTDIQTGVFNDAIISDAQIVSSVVNYAGVSTVLTNIGYLA